ncbi:hypothetical protein [Rosistilla oblonga]|uniref:hypothetical protein n=1 Tax=Rosistilla oblonga TaxID=2527990 RepID=UPI003A9881EF
MWFTIRVSGHRFKYDQDDEQWIEERDENDLDGDENTEEILPYIRELRVLGETAYFYPFADVKDPEEWADLIRELDEAFSRLYDRMRQHPVDAKEVVRSTVEGDAGGAGHVVWPG